MNGKFSARVPVSERVALRGSLGTGFRAPTPGQQNAFNVSAIYVIKLDDLVNNGTIPSTSAVARLRGGRPPHPRALRQPQRRRGTPFGFDGGFYYTRLDYRWGGDD